MARKLALFLIFVSAVLALVLFAAGTGTDRDLIDEPGAGSAAVASTGSSDELESTARSGPGEKEPTVESEVDRTHVSAPEATTRALTKTLRIRVVEKGTRDPVAGATVRYLPPNTWSESPPAARLRFQRLQYDLERQYEEFGKHLVSSEEGFVDIPFGSWGGSCTARKGELYGNTHVNLNIVPPPGGFVIESGDGNFYFSGDTALTYDMKHIAESTELKWAALCIGDNFTMGARDAARAAEFVGATRVLGIHFDTFPFMPDRSQNLWPPVWVPANPTRYKSTGSRLIIASARSATYRVAVSS